MADTFTLGWSAVESSRAPGHGADRTRGIAALASMECRERAPSVSPYPQSDLAEFDAEVARLADGANRAGIELTGMGVPTEMTHLEIYVKPGSGTNRVADLNAQIPVTVEEQESSVFAAGRQNANSPFRGGAVIKSLQTNGALEYCSTGVTVIQGDARRMLTTEHCQEREGRSVWTKPNSGQQHVGLSGDG